MVGIYKITSPNGKVYIGQSWDINQRKKNHRNCNGDTYLYNSIKKYGFENHTFEVAHELPDDVEQFVLDTYEQLYMDSYRDAGVELMNIREAGSKGKSAEESKRKQSISMQGVGKGRKQTEEWIKKRTECQVGNKNWLDKKHKEETKQKQSAASLGRHKSESHAKKCAENGRAQAIKNQKPVIQLSKEGEFIKEWASAKEAEDNSIALARSICHACKGIYHSAGGFKWKYGKTSS